jgi:hypothetical protein
MKRLIKGGGIKALALFLVMNLGVMPAGATVPGDIAAGLPLERVFANGLGAGLTIEAIVTQALDAGAEYCPVIKAARAQRLDLSRVFKALLERKCLPPEIACASCDLMKCAVLAGYDMVEVANALMAAGAKLMEVRACLGGLGFAAADTYAYSGPGTPVDSWGGPNFPGGGGGAASPSYSGGGGGVASPSL